MDPNTRIGGTTLARIQRASIKRILKDLVGEREEDFRDAIMRGVLAEPPRSFPYIALAASYLDTKAGEPEPTSDPVANLFDLSRDELLRRALGIAAKLQRGQQEQVIEGEIVPRREPTLAELEEDVRAAQAELERANEEVRRLSLEHRGK